MSAVIFDKRNGKIVHHFDTMQGAHCSFSRRDYKNTDPNMVLATIAEYRETGYVTANEMVEVKNAIGGNIIKIRRLDVGTCIDPSTERYHCM